MLVLDKSDAQFKVNGRTWSRSTGETDRRRAQRKHDQIEVEARLLREQPGGLPRLSQAICREVERLETDVSESAAERVGYGLCNFLDWLGKDVDLIRIDDRMIEDFQRDRLRKVALATVMWEIDAIIRMLVHRGITVRKPSFKPGRRTTSREFTPDELKRFFSGISSDEHRALFLTMLATGARPAELLPSSRSSHVALLKRELDEVAGTIIIRSAKCRPGHEGKVRIMPVSADLMALLNEVGKAVTGPHVFHPNGKLSGLFDRICKRAGIPKVDELNRKVTAHSFRHTFATMVARQVEFNPHLLRDLMGHSTLKMTDRYVHAHATAQVIDVSAFMEPAEAPDSGQLGVNAGCQSKESAVAEET